MQNIAEIDIGFLLHSPKIQKITPSGVLLPGTGGAYKNDSLMSHDFQFPMILALINRFNTPHLKRPVQALMIYLGWISGNLRSLDWKYATNSYNKHCNNFQIDIYLSI